MTDEKIGVSDENVWKEMVKNLYEFGTIKNIINTNELFTNEFINQ